MNVNVFQNISMTSHVAAFYLWLSLRFSTAVIFVMDSSNAERMAEAHDELAKLMAEKRLKDALLLVYANKQVSQTIHVSVTY